MKRPQLNPWLVVAACGGILYPFLVYFGMAFWSPSYMVLIGMVLVALRLWGMRHAPNAKLWQKTFLVAALLLLFLFFLKPVMAVKAYPVLISLSVAFMFGLSLVFPPSLVERIARLSEPDLPPAGVAYTRKVTIIWTGFLLINAAISAALALWGTLADWTLWNGLLSYLLMGALFAGEWIVRKRIKR